MKLPNIKLGRRFLSLRGDCRVTEDEHQYTQAESTWLGASAIGERPGAASLIGSARDLRVTFKTVDMVALPALARFRSTDPQKCAVLAAEGQSRSCQKVLPMH